MKTASPIWWEESPFHPLGPHQGRPGPVAPHEFGRERPPCIASAQDLPKAPSFHYPGDNETFSRGCRLSTALGLKQLGIWYQILDPGHRSSFPHAHTHEEECAIVLSGTGLVWDHGNPREFLVGDFVEFPAKTGRAHCLINNSEVPLVYLGIGEATDFPDEKIDYPLNPLRTEECLRKGWQWTDLQRPSLGPQSAHPIKRPSRHLAFRKVDSSQAAEVLDILQQAPKYFLNVEGVPPTLPTAIQSIEGVPKLPGPDFYKEFLIIEADHGPVGVIDLHLNHPEKGHAYLGLLLLTEGHQGQGLGRRSYQLLEDYLKRAHLCRKVRLGISQDQNQEAFWQKLGFEPNGRSYTWEGEQKTSRVLEYEKTIP